MFGLNFNKKPKPVKFEGEPVKPIIPERKVESVNEKALSLVNQAREVLDLVRKDPSMVNFHSEISGSKWNLEYLIDIESELINMYKTNSFRAMDNIPREVKDFQEDLNRFRFSNH
ncbi:MAG: hypothetical protein RI945_107 [Candidatus Parcubacteria bacterium]|jgi:hypothetical protein